MTTRQRISLTTGLAVFLALLSWVTIWPSSPTLLQPMNGPLFLAALLSTFLPIGARIITVVALFPVFFSIWCWPVLGGSTTLPTRSLALFVVAVAFSALWLAVGYRDGIRYQGAGYVVGVVIINSICWAVLSALAILARRRPSFGHNLRFHVGLFSWLTWCAFPYFGEPL